MEGENIIFLRIGITVGNANIFYRGAFAATNLIVLKEISELAWLLSLDEIHLK